MTYFIWLLRIIHIGAGIFWVGGGLIMAFFLGPTVGATGEAGQKVMVHLVGKLKISARLSAAAGSTVLAGAILYWIDSAGFTSAWMKSGAGTGFSIGAFFGLVGFVLGILVGIKITAMGKLAAQFQGKPTPEQLAEMGALQKQQMMYSNYSTYALIIAVIFMSVARYLQF
jgi:hypothetical protein